MVRDAPASPQAAPKPVEPVGEGTRMGEVSGVFWIVAAITGVVATFMPGAIHAGIGWLLLVSAGALVYGVSSVTGLIPWERASVNVLGFCMVVTVPVIGLAIYLTGASLSYIEP